MAAGDVNGDGIADLVIGSGDQNLIWVFKGRATGGLPTSPDFGYSGQRPGDRAGSSIRLLDIDHDGIRDIIIGAPNNDGPASDRADAGAAYIIWGSPTIDSRSLASADVIFYGASAGQLLGAHIAAGDINRDTPSDIVMAAPGGGGSAGELDIYYGRSDRTTYGVPGGAWTGQRIVDLAIATNVDRRIVGDASLGAIGFSQVFEVTGEGARDIVAGVPSQDGGAGAVYFTNSPSIVAASDTISVAVNRNASTTSSPVAITNRSIIAVTYSASSIGAWLTPSPATGSTTSTAPSQIAASVNAAGLAPGTYGGAINVTSTSKHLEMTETITVIMTVTDTRIAIDTPAAGAHVRQPFFLTGYAIDLSASTGTGVDQVHVYAFPAGGGPAIFVGIATYGSARSDVGGTYGAQFTNSGYSQRVFRLAPGGYTMVALARNAATGAFTVNATRALTIDNGPVPAQGDFDGDFMADPTIYRPNGDWVVRTSSGGYGPTMTKNWGGPGYTPARGDYDGDGIEDFGLYRESTGDWYVLLSGSGYASVIGKNWGGTGYKPVAADYDGDGKTDFAVYNTANGYWYILTSSSGFASSIIVNWGGAGYVPVGGLDFDGDARADIAVYHRASGGWYVLKSSTNYTTAQSIMFAGDGNTMVCGDYDGDGKADVGFYNRGSGRWHIAKSSSAYASAIDITFGGGGAAAAPADYDGDGMLDLAVFQAATGTWTVLKSSASYGSSVLTTGFGAPGDVAVSAAVLLSGTDESTRATDFDGDVRADMTVYSTSSAYWYTLKSSSSYDYSTAMLTNFGGSGYDAVPGDFDGDGRADRALYQPSSGNWYVLLSSTGFSTSMGKSVGGPGWVPVPGDYDGDGKSDFVVYNTSTGQWYGLTSGSGYAATVNISWGGTGYTAAPADFDGDGKIDLGIYHAASGNWYVRLSSTGYTTSMSKHAGGPDWIPVQADYDGDGRADFIAYNTTSGMWSGLKSSTNYTTTLSIGWGGTGYAAVKGDYDGDGLADLALYHVTSGNWYILLSGANYTTSLSKNWGGTGYAAVPMYP